MLARNQKNDHDDKTVDWRPFVLCFERGGLGSHHILSRQSRNIHSNDSLKRPRPIWRKQQQPASPGTLTLWPQDPPEPRGTTLTRGDTFQSLSLKKNESGAPLMVEANLPKSRPTNQRARECWELSLSWLAGAVLQPYRPPLAVIGQAAF